MATLDYQVEYNGLVMGADTDYRIVRVDGLEDLEARVGDTPVPRGNGDIPGLHTRSAKTITLEVVAVGGAKGTQAHRDAVQALHDAFSLQDTAKELYWMEPGLGQRRYLWARPVNRAAPRDPRYPFFAKVAVQLKVADPTIYGAAEKSYNMPLYDTSSGGTELPVADFPMDFGVDPSAGSNITNAGSTKAYPLIRFFGPTVGTVTSVSILNVTTGVTAQFDTTMLTGQTLSADMRRIVNADTSSTTPYVNLDGTNKYGEWQLPREPFYLAPGDNELRFNILAGTSTDAVCVLSFRDSW